MGHVDDVVRCDPLPRILKPGETANYFLPTQGADDWFKQLQTKADVFQRSFTTRRSLKRLRFEFYTSTGGVKRLKPESAVLDRIWDAIKTEKNAPDRRGNLLRKVIDWPYTRN
jgi:hypothetical protein